MSNVICLSLKGKGQDCSQVHFHEKRYSFFFCFSLSLTHTQPHTKYSYKNIHMNTQNINIVQHSQTYSHTQTQVFTNENILLVFPHKKHTKTYKQTFTDKLNAKH